jgi:hypothetical protein
VRRRRWWRRPIPLWQAAAACLLACAAGWWFSSSPEPDRPTTVLPKTVFVRLDEPLFPSEQSSADRLDISRWQRGN